METHAQPTRVSPPLSFSHKNKKAQRRPSHTDAIFDLRVAKTTNVRMSHKYVYVVDISDILLSAV